MKCKTGLANKWSIVNANYLIITKQQSQIGTISFTRNAACLNNSDYNRLDSGTLIVSLETTVSLAQISNHVAESLRESLSFG